jgi:flagellin
MALRIQNNIEAFNAHRQLVGSSHNMAKAMERLSSGYRINRAADDAAGLAISEKLRAQVGGLQQAQRNAQDAVSLVQTAEGALTEVHAMLQRVRDLAVQYSNGTLSNSDKAAITAEVAQLSAEVSRIASQTKFNGTSLLSGGATISFQIGVDDGNTITAAARNLFGSGATNDVDAAVFDFETQTTSAVLLASIDTAIANVSTARSTFGSIQNRLEHTLNNLASYEENLTASESRIRDVDMASEMVSFTKYQILQQAGTSMLAQANAAPQAVLSLLR